MTLTPLKYRAPITGDNYASDELRNAKNKIRRLLRDIMRIALELHYVRAALKVWMERARHLWVELMCRNSLKQLYQRRHQT